MPKITVIGLSGESVFLKTNEFCLPGETISCTSFHSEVGGKGYNQAVAINKMKTDVFYLSAIGDDEYGNKCEKYMNKLGIKNNFVRKLEKTAFATIITNKVGENIVNVYPGASVELCADDVKNIEDEIKTSDYLLLQFELSKDVINEACKIAKKYNIKVIINPAPAKYEINEFSDVYLFTPNEEEARKLYSIPNEITTSDFGEYLKNIVNCNVIVTLGEKGALYVNKNNYKYYEGIKVSVKDTTGAGDTFNGVLVAMLAKGFDMDNAIKYAIIASGLSVTKDYVMDAIPTLDDVKLYK